jgi:glycosyltransferase involved in cell wall biosynthesis
MSPTISVVIPTRDRADKLARLLHCIQKQTYDNFECLVIDDGSSADTRIAYESIWKDLDNRFILQLRSEDARWGGPGKTRNIGIGLARGDFVAFCDDDDLWVRDDHLSTAVAALVKYDADLFFANMQTSKNGAILIPDWLAVASEALWRTPVPEEADIFRVTREDMCHFLARRTLHADMLVVEKRLLTKIGMYYDREIFGEDVDIPFRLVDNAKNILCRSTVVAELEVSDHPSFIRSFRAQELNLCCILAYLRAETQVADVGLRRVARANRAWVMLELARATLRAGRRREAYELAAQALVLRPTMESLRVIGSTLLGSRRLPSSETPS